MRKTIFPDIKYIKKRNSTPVKIIVKGWHQKGFKFQYFLEDSIKVIKFILVIVFYRQNRIITPYKFVIKKDLRENI